MTRDYAARVQAPRKEKDTEMRTPLWFRPSCGRGQPLHPSQARDAGFALLEQVRGEVVALFSCHSRAKRRIPDLALRNGSQFFKKWSEMVLSR